jgi:DNA-directed RNA polymerase subunit omega
MINVGDSRYASELYLQADGGRLSGSFDSRSTVPGRNWFQLPELMKKELLEAALEIIVDRSMLVNAVSLRVRQLTFGHRPLMPWSPGMGAADVALGEIVNKKLTFALTPRENGKVAARKTFDPFANTLAKKEAA